MNAELFASSCFRVVAWPCPGKIVSFGFRSLIFFMVCAASSGLPENKSVLPTLFLNRASPENIISSFKMKELLPFVWPGVAKALKFNLSFREKVSPSLKVCRLLNLSLTSKFISAEAFL